MATRRNLEITRRLGRLNLKRTGIDQPDKRSPVIRIEIPLRKGRPIVGRVEPGGIPRHHGGRVSITGPYAAGQLAALGIFIGEEDRVRGAVWDRVGDATGGLKFAHHVVSRRCIELIFTEHLGVGAIAGRATRREVITATVRPIPYMISWQGEKSYAFLYLMC